VNLLPLSHCSGASSLFGESFSNVSVRKDTGDSERLGVNLSSSGVPENRHSCSELQSASLAGSSVSGSSSPKSRARLLLDASAECAMAGCQITGDTRMARCDGFVPLVCLFRASDG